MRAVGEKNRALALELREKNRRVAFLTAKCEALYRGRALADASLRCVRRQWLQLLDDLAVALQAQGGDAAGTDNWTDVLDAAESFGLLHTPAADLRLSLPEWFLAVTQSDAEKGVGGTELEDHAARTSVGAETDGALTDPTQFVAKEDLSDIEKHLHEQLTTTHERAQRLLAEILSAVTAKQAPEAKLELAKIAAERRAAVAQVLTLKDQVQTVGSCVWCR